MQYIPLGNTELSISRLSLGTMSLRPDSPESLSIIHQAYDAGVNFFDTADLYDKGANEEMLGKALKDRRDKVMIASKVGNQWLPDGSAWTWNPRKAYIMEAVKKSLTRLQTDYIDLYQLHGGTIDDPIDETIEAFEKLKEQGHIRYYGISSIRHNVIRAFTQRTNLASVMMQYSLLDRRPEEFALDYLREKGVAVLVRGALTKGLLLGKVPKAFLNHSAEAVATYAHRLEAGLSQGYDAAQAVQAFVLQHPAVSTLVMGVRTSEQLLANLRILELEAPAEDFADFLMHLTPANFYESHRE